jgi:hypothetical protein
VALSFFVCAAVFFSLTKISPNAMWHDMVIVYNAQDKSARLEKLLTKAIVFGPGICLLLIPVFEYISGLKRQEFRKADVVRQFSIIGLIAVSGVIVLSSNTQKNEIPLLAMGSLIFLEKMRRQNGSLPSVSENFMAIRYLVSFLVMWVFVWPTLSEDFASLRHSFKLALTVKHFAPIDSENMKEFFLPVIMTPWYAHSTRNIEDYHAELVEGMRLLRKNISDSGHVATIAFVDPFSFALGIQSPKGGITNWAWGVTLNRRSHPSPARVFNDVNYVLLPNNAGFQAEFSIYNDMLYRLFRKIDDSSHWLLWKRIELLG